MLIHLATLTKEGLMFFKPEKQKKGGGGGFQVAHMTVVLRTATNTALKAAWLFSFKFRSSRSE